MVINLLWLWPLGLSAVPRRRKTAARRRRAGPKRSTSQIYEAALVFTLARKGEDRREEPESCDEDTDEAVSCYSQDGDGEDESRDRSAWITDSAAPLCVRPPELYAAALRCVRQPPSAIPTLADRTLDRRGNVTTLR